MLVECYHIYGKVLELYIKTVEELKAKTEEMKLPALKMCEKSEEGYPSSGFSCAEIMTVLLSICFVR